MKNGNNDKEEIDFNNGAEDGDEWAEILTNLDMLKGKEEIIPCSIIIPIPPSRYLVRLGATQPKRRTTGQMTQWNEQFLLLIDMKMVSYTI